MEGSTEVSCHVIGKAGLKQIRLCLLHCKNSCKIFSGHDNLSRTVENWFEH